MNRYNFDNVYIVAEIGQNHNGDIEIAKELIDEARIAGCSAVKSAKRYIPHELTKEAYDRPYNNPNSFGKTYGQHRVALELTNAEHVELKKYTNRRKMDYFLSVCDMPSLNFALKLNPPLVKIPSKEIFNKTLMERAAYLQVPVAFSLGTATKEDMNDIELRMDKDFFVFTTSQYPTELDNIHLKRIKNPNFTKVGFSCHYPDPMMGIVAVALGASYIEYHITLDREMKGSDHSSSLEMEAFAYLVDGIHDLEIAMGDSSLPQELPNYLKEFKKKYKKHKCEDGIYRT